MGSLTNHSNPNLRSHKLNPTKILKGSSLRAQVAKASGASLILKALSALLGFGTTVILARTLGPEQYGLYAFVLATITVIALPAKAGLPQLVTRETAKAGTQSDLGTIKGVWRWSTVMVIAISATLLTVATAVTTLNTHRLSEAQLTTFLLALLLIPLMGFSGIRSAALRGLGNTVQGQLPELVVRPSVLLLLLLVFAVFYWGGSISPQQAVSLNITSAAVGFIVGAYLLYKNCPAGVNVSQAKYEPGPWISAIIPMAAVGGMHLINTQADIILIALFMENSDVGHYRVAAQTSLVVAFGLQATKMVVQPQFSALYHKGDIKNLQRLATAASRVNLAVAVIILIPVFAWGTDLLQISFGAAFAAAYLPMVILSAGRLLGSSVGSSGHLLNMAGYQKKYANFWLLAAILNIILNMILIPLFGTTGAAIATASTLILANMLGWWGAKRWIGCDCSPL